MQAQVQRLRTDQPDSAESCYATSVERTWQQALHRRWRQWQIEFSRPAAIQIRAWIITNWRDLLLGAAIVISGAVGYVAFFLWLSRLASLPVL